MKAATILSLAAAAVAAPTAFQPRADETAAPNTFTGLALRSASNIHFLTVNANGQQFWLNKPTATYCPSSAGASCPANDASNPAQTIFGGGNPTIGLSATVPGGQQIYVNPSGFLKFTQAHSGSQDAGSTMTGFSVDEAGDLLFEGQSWYACNSGEEGDNSHVILAASKSDGTGYAGGCQGFNFRTSPTGENSQTQWQYV